MPVHIRHHPWVRPCTHTRSGSSGKKKKQVLKIMIRLLYINQQGTKWNGVVCYCMLGTPA